MRCSWVHCPNVFEGRPPDGWKLVARHLSTGEQVVVCPEHVSEAADADLRALLKLFQEPGSSRTVHRLFPEEPEPEVTRKLGRPLK